MNSIEDDSGMSSIFTDCHNLHILRLDNCSRGTISNIISMGDLPVTQTAGEEVEIDGEMTFIDTRIIYCKESEAAGLTPPESWVFEYVD